ncbi:hypothetical protein AB7M17_005137 [Bradyrhizobium sp. USDA 377]
MRDDGQILDRALSFNKGDIAGAAKLDRRVIKANPGNLFVEAKPLGEDQIADMIRDLEVDILVDHIRVPSRATAQTAAGLETSA